MSTSDATSPPFEPGQTGDETVPYPDVRLVLRTVVESAQIGLGRLQAVLDNDEAWTQLATTVGTMSALATPVARSMMSEVFKAFVAADAKSSSSRPPADEYGSDECGSEDTVDITTENNQRGVVPNSCIAANPAAHARANASQGRRPSRTKTEVE
jgi:hypothetical protein